MQLKVEHSFSWAHGGTQVRDYARGDNIDTDDNDLITVATREGWAKESRASKAAPESRVRKAAPENKSAGE